MSTAGFCQAECTGLSSTKMLAGIVGRLLYLCNLSVVSQTYHFGKRLLQLYGFSVKYILSIIVEA